MFELELELEAVLVHLTDYAIASMIDLASVPSPILRRLEMLWLAFD
jgi:hypothetical protein